MAMVLRQKQGSSQQEGKTSAQFTLPPSEQKKIDGVLRDTGLIDNKGEITDKGKTVGQMLLYLNVGQWGKDERLDLGALLKTMDACGVFGKDRKRAIAGLTYVLDKLGFGPSLSKTAAESIINMNETLDLLKSARRVGRNKEVYFDVSSLQNAIAEMQTIGTNIFRASTFGGTSNITENMSIDALLQQLKNIEKRKDHTIEKKAISLEISKLYGSFNDLKQIAKELGVDPTKAKNSLQLYIKILNKIANDKKFRNAINNWPYGYKVFDHMDLITEYVFVTRVVPILKQRLVGNNEENIDTKLTKIIHQLSQLYFHSQYFPIMFLKLTHVDKNTGRAMLYYLDPEQFPAICYSFENMCNGIIRSRPWDAEEQMFKFGSKINTIFLQAYEKRLFNYIHTILQNRDMGKEVVSGGYVSFRDYIRRATASDYKTITPTAELREIIMLSLYVSMATVRWQNTSTFSTNLLRVLREPNRVLNEYKEMAEKLLHGERLDIFKIEVNKPLLTMLMLINPSELLEAARAALPNPTLLEGQYERMYVDAYGSGTYFNCGTTGETKANTNLNATMTFTGISAYTRLYLHEEKDYLKEKGEEANQITNTFMELNGDLVLNRTLTQALIDFYESNATGSKSQSHFFGGIQSRGPLTKDLTGTGVLRLQKDENGDWKLSLWAYNKETNTYNQIEVYNVTEDQAKRILEVFGKRIGTAGGVSLAGSANKLYGAVVMFKFSDKSWVGALVNARDKSTGTKQSATGIVEYLMSNSEYNIIRLYGDKNTIQLIDRYHGITKELAGAGGLENKQAVGGGIYISRNVHTKVGLYALHDIGVGTIFGGAWQRLGAYAALNINELEKKWGGTFVTGVSFGEGREKTNVDFGASTTERMVLYNYTNESDIIYLGDPNLAFTLETLKAASDQLDRELAAPTSEEQMIDALRNYKILLQGWNAVSEMTKNTFNLYLRLALPDTAWKTLVSKNGTFITIFSFPVNEHDSATLAIGGKVNSIGGLVRYAWLSHATELNLVLNVVSAAILKGGTDALATYSHYTYQSSNKEGVEKTNEHLNIVAVSAGDVDSIGYVPWMHRTSTISNLISKSKTVAVLAKVSHLGPKNNIAFLGLTWVRNYSEIGGSNSAWLLQIFGVHNLSIKSTGGGIKWQYGMVTNNIWSNLNLIVEGLRVHPRGKSPTTYVRGKVNASIDQPLSDQTSATILNTVAPVIKAINSIFGKVDL